MLTEVVIHSFTIKLFCYILMLGMCVVTMVSMISVVKYFSKLVFLLVCYSVPNREYLKQIFVSTNYTQFYNINLQERERHIDNQKSF
jgi:hypothetical protein